MRFYITKITKNKKTDTERKIKFLYREKKSKIIAKSKKNASCFEFFLKRYF